MTGEEVEKFLNNVPGLKPTDFFISNQIKRWQWTNSSIIAFQLDHRCGEFRTVVDGICINFFDADKTFYVCSKMFHEQPRFLVSKLTPARLQEIVDRNLDIQKKVDTELGKRKRSVLLDEL